MRFFTAFVVAGTAGVILERTIITEAAEQPGISGKHTIKRDNAAAPVFIAYFQPYTVFFVLAFFDDTIAEARIIGRGYFVYIYNDHFVADDIMRQVIAVVDNHIIAQVSADDGAVVQPHRPAQVVKFQVERLQLADANQSIEFTVLHQFGRKSVRNKDLVPVVRGIAVAYQHLYFIRGQLPVVNGVFTLPVAQVVFIFTCRQVIIRNKPVT